MSRSIDLFIDAPLDLDDLASELAGLTGYSFDEVPGRPGRVLRRGEVIAELGGHDFIDDRELLFSRYPYVLTATVAAGQSVNDSPQAAVLRHVFAAVKADRRFGSLLVFDLQHLMDRAGPTGQAVAP